eukprot:SAG31_NODE_19837_length_590_cov_1.274949_2_plen_124_part_00
MYDLANRSYTVPVAFSLTALPGCPHRTGRHPSHIGQQTEMNLNPMPGIACGIALQYDFMPKVLRKVGYKTVRLGCKTFFLPKLQFVVWSSALISSREYGCIFAGSLNIGRLGKMGTWPAMANR